MTIQSKPAPCTVKEGKVKEGTSNKDTPKHSIAAKISENTDHPLRSINEKDFIELGVGHVVFVRSISVRELRTFVPEAQAMPDDLQFQMIVGANGTPVLIADNIEAIDDWFEQNSVRTVLRH